MSEEVQEHMPKPYSIVWMINQRSFYEQHPEYHDNIKFEIESLAELQATEGVNAALIDAEKEAKHRRNYSLLEGFERTREINRSYTLPTQRTPLLLLDRTFTYSSSDASTAQCWGLMQWSYKPSSFEEDSFCIYKQEPPPQLELH